MIDLAHLCLACRTVTIFHAGAPCPRRCGNCDAIVRTEPVDHPKEDDDFVLELRSDSMDVAPF